MAYIFVSAIVIGIPFYLVWSFINYIFFSDDKESKASHAWSQLITTIYVIVAVGLISYGIFEVVIAIIHTFPLLTLIIMNILLLIISLIISTIVGLLSKKVYVGVIGFVLLVFVDIRLNQYCIKFLYG